jgi:hypothetical protein
MTYFNCVADEVEDLIPLIDKWGLSGNLPAHVRRLSGGVRCALLLDQAGRFRLRARLQRHGHSLAERN